MIDTPSGRLPPPEPDCARRRDANGRPATVAGRAADSEHHIPMIAAATWSAMAVPPMPQVSRT
jgi:hypothetical protein